MKVWLKDQNCLISENWNMNMIFNIYKNKNYKIIKIKNRLIFFFIFIVSQQVNEQVIPLSIYQVDEIFVANKYIYNFLSFWHWFDKSWIISAIGEKMLKLKEKTCWSIPLRPNKCL